MQGTGKFRFFGRPSRRRVGIRPESPVFVEIETMDQRRISAVKVLSFAASIVALAVSAGCVTRMHAFSRQPVRSQIEVYARSFAERHPGAKLALFPFSAPAEAEEAAGQVTGAYGTMLEQWRPFRETVTISRPVGSDSEALWYARSAGCDLAMRPSVRYLMDGTGALPTRLDVRIRILDARTEKTLWDVSQIATSEPGADVDMFWWTLSGDPAQRYTVLAQSLAAQFAAFLAEPVEAKKK
jgi:hypothetical protein